MSTAHHLAIEKIEELYSHAFAKFTGKERKDVEVVFYPYVGLNHTIRVRNGKVLVRISDSCVTMSREGHKALAEILVAKLLGKKVPAESNRIYNSNVKDEKIQAKNDSVKRARGRKIITSASGDVYDLSEIFNELNEEYFNGELSRPTLSWSQRRTYNILGHHDPAFDTIVISKSLDDGKVPRFIVRYVLYHEMLHIAHPTKIVNGKRFNHTPEFKKDEKRFKEYKAAERWIDDNVSKLKRRAKRKK